MAGSTGQAAEPSDTSRQLAEQAVKSNPGIAALKSQIQALQQRVRQAGAWLDPRAAVEYSNVPIDSWALGDHPMSGLQLKLQQTFLFPGKTGLRQAVARGEVREARLQLQEQKVQLRALVRRAYVQLSLVRQLRAVNQSHIKLLDQFLDVVRVRYEVGKVGQHDLLRLQLLRDRLTDDLDRSTRDDRALTATLNAALSRPVGQVIATPERLVVPPARGTVKKLAALAEEHRPLLRWHGQRARTRQAGARRAEREVYPDFTAWVGYRIRLGAGADPGTDFVSMGLSVPLPLFSRRKWSGQQQEQRLRAQAALERRRQELDQIRGALGRALAAWQRAEREARVYRETLMPQAHRTLDATFAAYQVDRADFASLFQAERELLEFERTVRRAEAQSALQEVEVERLVGAPVDAPRDPDKGE
jgi:outer membrane protein TolC